MIEYWWEGSLSAAMSPISASDFVGLRKEIEGITFNSNSEFSRGEKEVNSEFFILFLLLLSTVHLLSFTPLEEY